MLGDGDGRILRNIAGHFLCALLDDETSETAEIDVVVFDQRISYVHHERLDNGLNQYLLSTPVLLAISFTISALVIAISYL